MGIGINPNHTSSNGENYLWENLTIPYEIDDTFAGDNKHRLLDMINEWNDSRMVVKYKPHDGEDNCVVFKETDDRMGSSPVGCVKDGNPQLIKIDLDEKLDDSLLHEMGHAAGLHHEHQRHDRNNYIEMDHTMFDIDYNTGLVNNSNDYWAELIIQYNALYDPDIDDDDYETMQDVISRYGIIPESHEKYKIYTCYDYRSIMHYKTPDIDQMKGTKYDTARSHPEVFGGYNYVDHSPFVLFGRDVRNDQTARNGLSFNDIYTIWRIYSADCPLPSSRCTRVRSRALDIVRM